MTEHIVINNDIIIAEQLVNFDTALLAKEKGFNIACNYRYNKFGRLTINNDFTCQAPTQSLLQKWLRHVHKIHVSPIFIGPDTNKYQCRIDIENSGKSAIYSKWFTSYEECLDAGLQEALKLI